MRVGSQNAEGQHTTPQRIQRCTRAVPSGMSRQTSTSVVLPGRPQLWNGSTTITFTTSGWWLARAALLPLLQNCGCRRLP